MHIDSNFVPLAPGKVLVNPEYVDPARLPAMFKSWEVLVAPRPDPPPLSAWRFRVSQCSPWKASTFSCSIQNALWWRPVRSL